MKLNTIFTAQARCTVISTLAGLVLATALPHVGFAQSTSDIGVWTLNVGKSSYSSSSKPQSNTLTIQRLSGTNRLLATTRGVDAEGHSTASKFIIMFDGEVQPLSGAGIQDQFSSHRVARDNTEYTRWRDGNIVQTGNTLRSADGRTLTFSTKGANAAGQRVSNVLVYDKKCHPADSHC